MKRRDFITLIGSTAVVWPLRVHAQQLQQRVGVRMSTTADDREGQARHAAFVDGLRQLGQTEGRNVQIDTRWPADDAARRRSAQELVAQAPDVIVASGSASVTVLQRITRRVPIVFANVIDPVGAELVASLSRPGGNITGFSSFDYSLSGKWLELLKEIAPNLKRIAVLRDPALAAGIGQFAVIQAMMPPSFGVELTAIDERDPGEIERAITAFAREPHGGLIVAASPSAVTHRDRIISIATRCRLPNVLQITATINHPRPENAAARHDLAATEFAPFGRIPLGLAGLAARRYMRRKRQLPCLRIVALQSLRKFHCAARNLWAVERFDSRGSARWRHNRRRSCNVIASPLIQNRYRTAG